MRWQGCGNRPYGGLGGRFKATTAFVWRGESGFRRLLITGCRSPSGFCLCGHGRFCATYQAAMPYLVLPDMRCFMDKKPGAARVILTVISGMHVLAKKIDMAVRARCVPDSAVRLVLLGYSYVAGCAEEALTRYPSDTRKGVKSGLWFFKSGRVRCGRPDKKRRF